MKRNLLLYFLLFSLSIAAQQKNLIIGDVCDKETKAAVAFATVQLCAPKDTSLVAGGVTDEQGKFQLQMMKEGSYLLKVSFMGYEPCFQTVTVKRGEENIVLPKIFLEQNATLLAETVISAEMPEVLSVEDTVVFNAGAFKVPEGSMLEDLLKRLPGAEVGDGGTLKINGKTISMIMIDGEEFFTSDMSVAMKNIPTTMIDQLKTYDRQSDQARITGVEDEEEQTVLDLKVKKDMSKGYFNNLDVSGGKNDLYSLNTNLNRFNKKDKYTFIGNMRNVEGPRSNNNGNTQRIQTGVNIINKKEFLEVNGNVNYNRSSGDATTEGSTERFLTNRNSFSNSHRRNSNESDSYRGEVKLEWKPDTLWNILTRASFNYSSSGGANANRSGTFKNNPYLYSDNPLDEIETEGLFPDDVRVNYSENTSKSDGDRLSGNIQFQINRRFAKKGRNLTLRLTSDLNSNKNESFTRSTTRYFLVDNSLGEDSLLYRNRYVHSPSESSSLSSQLTYVEPIFTKMYLQFYYKFTYRNNWNDRSTYDLSPYIDVYDESTPIGYLPDDYGEPVNSLSKSAEYDNYIHEGQFSYRIQQKKLKFSLGVRLTNTTTDLKFKQHYLDTVVSRNVTNFSPNMVFRYLFTKTTNVKIEYWCRNSQPSMTDLLPVRDESNPMNVWEGNPDLKPIFQNQLKAQFNTYNSDKQRGMNAYLQYDVTQNSISNKIVYDEETGGVVRSPANINGNWNLNGNFGFNTALKDKRFSVNTYTGGGLQNQVGYLRVSSNTDSQKNNTFTTTLQQRLTLRFHNDWIDVSAYGNISYNHTNNELQPNNNLETYRYSYGGNLNVQLPLNFSISSTISENSRRGYDNDNYNTDELLWNMQIAFKFMSEKAATVSLNFYDILNQLSNVSRQISASSRSDTKYNTIHSYWMLHFIYRLNIFGV